MIFLEVNRVRRRDPEIAHELTEDLRISAGPGEDRLLVITDCKNVVMLAGERVNHAILS